MRSDERRIAKARKELKLVKVLNEDTRKVYILIDDENQQYIHYQLKLKYLTNKSKTAMFEARRWLHLDKREEGNKFLCECALKEMGGMYMLSGGDGNIYYNAERVISRV